LNRFGLGADYSAAIQQQATALGIPPALALALATKESGLNPAAIGSAGEVGLFQVKPSTAGAGVNLYDPNANILAGESYLKSLYNQYGDWSTALAAYNEGPGNLAKSGVFPSTQAYVSSIMAAAGMNQSADTPDYSASQADFSATEPSDETTTSGMLDSLTSSTGLSGTALAILAVAGIGILVWMVRRS
jgi:soluble lytic murein transglycosylase-like protein